MRFLEKIAEIVLDKYKGSTDSLTIVFPNRRAGLFFSKYLSNAISKPIWSPTIISIEDFIKGLSSLKTPDRLELIYELYDVFAELNKSKEAFDKFYFWGNVLLQDFDEVDKFIVDGRLLFKNLVHIKNLEGSLDYLNTDQKELILSFWKSFGDKLSKQQKGFLGIWDNLFETYAQFKKRLLSQNLGYGGMIYRQVVDDLQAGKISLDDEKVIFAGFNALSKSEEEIISWLVKEEKAEVFWDADDHYFKNNKQEAGRYLREMKYGNSILRNSFNKTYGNAFQNSDKQIEVISVASEVGQAQEAAVILKSIPGKIDENTAVVLPNNSLLFPLLHAIPENIEKLNITMGYPLAASSIYGLLDALISLHLKSEGKSVFYFRNILAVLKHPLIAQFQDEKIDGIISDIQKFNTLWISRSKLDRENKLLRVLFQDPKPSIANYLIEVIQYLLNKNNEEVEIEFAFQFYQLLNKLIDFIQVKQLNLSLSAFQKIFRQLAQAERLPFEGEPLLGLQVMGILETRNLDFENIIVLSMNEGLIPPAPKNTSFIPYSIRKVFGLPVVDHQDAMYSYIFYRLVQRAKNMYFIYNSTEETGKSGEISRFVRQLEGETDIKIMHRNVASDVIVEDPNIITVEKNDEILDRLLDYTSKKNYNKRFTPTAINTYLDCRLKFYFRYVLGIKEQDEIAEDVDAKVFGNILHHVMERLYQEYDVDGNRSVTKDDINKIEKRINDELKNEFAKQFGSEEKDFAFEGQNVLAKEIIKKMILKMLDYDRQQAPFEILGVEADESKGYEFQKQISANETTIEVGLKGIIDRIEKKEDHVRIVDYKTGNDEKSFTDISSLFNREQKRRSKAVLQTFLYGLLYLNSAEAIDDLPVQASLFNIRDLFRSDFSPLIQAGKGNFKKDIQDIRIYLEEFQQELGMLLEEIFNRSVPFNQAEDLKRCSYCQYSGICNR